MKLAGLLVVSVVAQGCAEVVTPRPMDAARPDDRAVRPALDRVAEVAVEVEPNRPDVALPTDEGDAWDASEPDVTAADVPNDMNARGDVPLVQRSLRSCPDPRELGCGAAVVSGGEFRDRTLYAAPRPPLEVRVGAFALDRYEVTVARFRRFYQAGMPRVASVRYRGRSSAGERIWWAHPYIPYEEPRAVPAVDLPPGEMRTYTWTREPSGRESLPITRIQHNVAQAFCVWDGGRLPTITELRYVSLVWPASGPTVEPRPYLTGDTHPTCDDGNWFYPTECASQRQRGFTPVGSFRPHGPFYDLLGNAQEWAADRCDPRWSNAEPGVSDSMCMIPVTETCWPGSPPRCVVPYSHAHFYGGDFRTTDILPEARRGYPFDRYEISGIREEWDYRSGSTQYFNSALTGVRCAYDLP